MLKSISLRITISCNICWSNYIISYIHMHSIHIFSFPTHCLKSGLGEISWFFCSTYFFCHSFFSVSPSSAYHNFTWDDSPPLRHLHPRHAAARAFFSHSLCHIFAEAHKHIVQRNISATFQHTLFSSFEKKRFTRIKREPLEPQSRIPAGTAFLATKNAHSLERKCATQRKGGNMSNRADSTHGTCHVCTVRYGGVLRLKIAPVVSCFAYEQSMVDKYRTLRRRICKSAFRLEACCTAYLSLCLNTSSARRRLSFRSAPHCP